MSVEPCGMIGDDGDEVCHRREEEEEAVEVAAAVATVTAVPAVKCSERHGKKE